MPRPKANWRTAQLRIMLVDVMPHVWRQVLVPESISLPKLHSVILCSMGWQGGHLHEFDFGSVRFGELDEEWPDEGLRSERGVRLSQAMGGWHHHFEHRYDFGDGWQHWVVVENLFEPDAPLKSARCIDGQNACPPEDVGGTLGYADFQTAIADPNHEEHHNYLDWNGGPFDPTAFNIDDINNALAQIKV